MRNAYATKNGKEKKKMSHVIKREDIWALFDDYIQRLSLREEKKHKSDEVKRQADMQHLCMKLELISGSINLLDCRRENEVCPVKPDVPVPSLLTVRPLILSAQKYHDKEKQYSFLNLAVKELCKAMRILDENIQIRSKRMIELGDRHLPRYLKRMEKWMREIAGDLILLTEYTSIAMQIYDFLGRKISVENIFYHYWSTLHDFLYSSIRNKKNRCVVEMMQENHLFGEKEQIIWREIAQEIESILEYASIRREKIMDYGNNIEKGNTCKVKYSEYEDKSLHEVFCHIGAIAKEVQSIHAYGVSHLNLEASMIYVNPKNENWAELVEDKAIESNRKSDLFSLGAMLFYRLYKRDVSSGFPENWFCAPEKTVYDTIAYEPELSRKLHIILRSSLKDTNNDSFMLKLFIRGLDELIEMTSKSPRLMVFESSEKESAADEKSSELACIDKLLASHGVVFLNGAEGTGKTFLINRYVDEYREKYGAVILCKWENTIRDTVLSDKAILSDVTDFGDDKEQLFERKLRLMGQMLSENDLVIIDDFSATDDYESEEWQDIRSLLKLPCKFLIAAENTIGSGYVTYCVSSTDNMEQLANVFRMNNLHVYSEEEKESILRLFERVDGNAFMVKMVACYLAKSDKSPEELLKMMQTEQDVLWFLFQQFFPDEQARKPLFELALLGREEISLEELAGCKDFCMFLKALFELAGEEWIDYNPDKNSYSLHSLVYQMAMKHIQPTVQNYREIVEKMIQYLKNTDKTGMGKHNRMAEHFMSVITGNDLLYAELCLEYGKYEYLLKAEEICMNSEESKRDYILTRLYIALWPGLVAELNRELSLKCDVECSAYCAKKKDKMVRIIRQFMASAERYPFKSEEKRELYMNFFWMVFLATEREAEEIKTHKDFWMPIFQELLIMLDCVRILGVQKGDRSEMDLLQIRFIEERVEAWIN